MKYKPDRASTISSVVPVHGGASYNPDFDAHQHLLKEENEREVERLYHQNKLDKKAAPPAKEDRVTEEDIFKESVQGLGIISEDEYVTDEEAPREPMPIKKPIRAEDRKDKKDRRKARKQVLEGLR